MAALILRRLAAAALLVAIVLTLTFFLIRLVPGDPAALLDDPRVPPAHSRALREAWGLDRPLPIQYVTWLRAVVIDRDWGISFSHGQPVARVVARYLPNTLRLATAALLLQFGVGVGIGMAAARRAGRWPDHLIRTLSMTLYALPTFWVGLMALLLLSHVVPLFPPGQLHSLDAAELPALRRWLDALHHLALPAIVLGLATAGGIGRHARAALLDVLGEDWVRTARAKGLGERAVLWRHAFRNALAPLAQLLGLSLPFLLSGALVVEHVFAWPGMGQMTYAAILARDYPLVLAGTAISATLVVAGALLADLLQGLADPRARGA